MQQHILSRWLLKSFARGERDLAVFDKAVGEYSTTRPRRFMTETDAHSDLVERELEAIEGPAASAGQRLAARLKPRPPALYALGPGDAVPAKGDRAPQHVGTVEQMAHYVSPAQIAAPSRRDLVALGRFAALMFRRAPKLMALDERVGQAYSRGASIVLSRLLPGISVDLDWIESERRSRMAQAAVALGPRIASFNWWVLKAPDGQEFVLGDTPVAATLSLGHDDVWHPLLSDQSLVIVMPISRSLAVIVAPQRLLTITGIESETDWVPAINRVMWRWAERYLLAGSQKILEGAAPGADASWSVAADGDLARAEREGVHDTVRIIAGARWMRWDGCRQVIGGLAAGEWPALLNAPAGGATIRIKRGGGHADR